MVWTYLGPSETIPPLPDFPWIEADTAMRLNTCQINGCNYVQMLEGLLDSSHLTVLHSSALNQASGSDLGFVKATSHMQFDAAPLVESETTAFGIHYAAIRMLDGMAETRVTAFIAPFWVLNPNGDIVVAVVPLSDVKTAFYTVWWDGKTRYGAEPLRTQQLELIGFDQSNLEAYGQTRQMFDGPNSIRHENGFRQDRALMHAGHFTGVPTLALEDSLVSISAGPVRDRTTERLSISDLAIGHLYRHLLRVAREERDGDGPIGHGVSVAHVVGTNASLDPGTDWRTLVPQHYGAGSMTPPGS